MSKKNISRQLHRKPQFHLKPVYAAVLLIVAIQTAQANPIGGTVTSGQASFNTSGNTLTVTNTPGTIINWQGFSIGSNEITNFAQQSASSTVLNRVVGSDPSSILGTLQSNGRVFLINPHGIVFGAGSIVDVAGLVASSLNLSDADFIAGKNRFTEVPGAGNVSNAGNITAAQGDGPAGGQIYLIAPNVENTGIITAPNGEILLAAGASVDLVNTNDPNLRVSITAPAGDATNVGQLIASSGSLGLFGTVVRNSGTVSADSATMQGGKIVFRASRRVEAGGTISASGTTGGNIAVLGNQVAVLEGAMVSANGTGGGGTILIGGDAHGANPDVQNAQMTYVAPTATISADATQSGDGGKVVVWADNATEFRGHISARGGAVSGNGGWVEVSGKQWLDYAGLTDTTAANGMVGSLLLDPTDITIRVNANSVTMIYTGGVFADVTNSPSTLNVTTLQTQLALSNVRVDSNSGQTGAGNITVADSLAWNSPNTLTLNAAGTGTIFVNTNTNSIVAVIPLSINVAGGGSLVLQTANGSIGIGAAGGINISGGGSFTANAGGATSDLLFNSVINTGAGAINLTAGRNINEFGGGSLTTTGLLTTKSDTGTTLNGANSVGSFSATNTGGGSGGIIELTNSAANLTVVGISQTNLGAVMLSNSGNITPTGAVTAGTFTLNGGIWNQVSATLSGFTVNDFRLSGGTFRRALSGDGSAGNPYLLTDIYGVQGIDSSAVMLGNNYVLANNIDASGTANWAFGQGFVPIGNANQAFSGTFDGQNHTINNLFINRTDASNIGLFGRAVASSISNVGLVSPVVAGISNVGALAGYNSGSISNSYVSGGSVSGIGSNVGGLVGWNQGGAASINSSYANGGSVVAGQTSGAVNAGGLVGYNTGGISNSYVSNGNVSGSGVSAWYFGGLVGQNDIGGSISNTYASNGVLSGAYVGGLVGYNHSVGGAVVSNSFWNTTTATGVSFGIGFDTGTATGINIVGGVTGMNDTNMKKIANFNSATAANGNVNPGWNIANSAGANATWFIYEGITMPLLNGLSAPPKIVSVPNLIDEIVYVSNQNDNVNTRKPKVEIIVKIPAGDNGGDAPVLPMCS